MPCSPRRGPKKVSARGCSQGTRGDSCTYAHGEEEQQEAGNRKDAVGQLGSSGETPPGGGFARVISKAFTIYMHLYDQLIRTKSQGTA